MLVPMESLWAGQKVFSGSGFHDGGQRQETSMPRQFCRHPPQEGNGFMEAAEVTKVLDDESELKDACARKLG